MLRRTLKFKHAEYASNTRKSRSMFTRVALKEGPVDPAESNRMHYIDSQ